MSTQQALHNSNQANQIQDNSNNSKTKIFLLVLLIIFILAASGGYYYYYNNRKENNVSGPVSSSSSSSPKSSRPPSNNSTSSPNNSTSSSNNSTPLTTYSSNEPENESLSVPTEDVDNSTAALDEMIDSIEQPIIDTTSDNSLKDFSGYTTIADNNLSTTVDIDKVAYLSPDGNYKLSFQTDNNLVIYDKNGRAVWHTNTVSSSNSYLKFQSDGNLTIYELTDLKWESGTFGGGQYLVFNNKGQLLTLNDMGEEMEFVVEYHKGNANLSEYILRYSDIFRAYSSGWYGNNTSNPREVKHKSWHMDGALEHYTVHGRGEGRIMNYIQAQDDNYNMDGKEAFIMPKNSGWGIVKDSQNRIDRYAHINWIWKYQMPLEVGGHLPNDFFSNNDYTSVPIEVVKFYNDFKNSTQYEVDAEILIHVDDRADIILNDVYLKSVAGWDNEPIAVKLQPGKNRLMIVAWNLGGPGGLQAVVRNPVTDYWYTSTMNGWRYIDDLQNILGFYEDSILDENAEWPNCQLKIPNDQVDFHGNLQFHYDYMNNTGKRIRAKMINPLFDDYGTLWVDRKLINSKCIGEDPTDFYFMLEPGKNRLCFEVMNYGGPGGVRFKVVDIETGEEIMVPNNQWRFFTVDPWKPGPHEKITIFHHNLGSDPRNKLWIGHYNRGRMEAMGIPNDTVTSISVPRMLEGVLWSDDNANPHGQSLYFKGNTEADLMEGWVGWKGPGDFNDWTSAITVKTLTKDRALFFKHHKARHEDQYNEPFQFSNFYPSLGPGEYDRDLMKTFIMENDISSVYVPKTLRLKVYHDPGFQNIFDTVETDNKSGIMRDLANDNNNSAIIVENKEGDDWLFNVMNDYLLCNKETLCAEMNLTL